MNVVVRELWSMKYSYDKESNKHASIFRTKTTLPTTLENGFRACGRMYVFSICALAQVVLNIDTLIQWMELHSLEGLGFRVSGGACRF